jgi:peroxiredoxin
MTMRQAAAEEKAKVQSIVGDKFGLITGDIERIRKEGTIKDALKVGQSIPDFTLPDAFGAQISIKTLLAKGPVVIMFYRGEWCPFCNIEMRAMQKALPQMQELGATQVAISPEKPDHGIVMAEKNKLTFPVLSDFGNKVAKQFGIVFQMDKELSDFVRNTFKNDIGVRNGQDSWELPVPATYVVDSAGIIRFARVEVDFMMDRAEPEEVVAVLQTLALK